MFDAFSLMSTIAMAAIPGLLITGLVLYFTLVPLLRSRKQNQRVLATGLPGEATVRAVSNTGVRINSKPQLNILVDVAPTEMGVFSPFQAQLRAVVPELALSMVLPGSRLPVRCITGPDAKVAVDWQAMGIHGAG